MSYLFTSESVSEGHPDKIADQISDALIDNYLAFDPSSKVACETLVTTGLTVLAGEVKSTAHLDAQKIARKVAAGELLANDITEQHINEHISTAGMPDPDLYIRTSGEYRISNFLLWQAAYAEFYFTDTLWPDFDENEFTQALLQYTDRDRRFGTAVDKIVDVNELSESVKSSKPEPFSKEKSNKTAA